MNTLRKKGFLATTFCSLQAYIFSELNVPNPKTKYTQEIKNKDKITKEIGTLLETYTSSSDINFEESMINIIIKINNESLTPETKTEYSNILTEIFDGIKYLKDNDF